MPDLNDLEPNDPSGYRQLATLLDDSAVRALRQVGDRRAAVRLRDANRKAYWTLLLSFEREAGSISRGRVRSMEIRGDWSAYRKEFKRRWGRRALSGVLRALFWLDTAHLLSAYRSFRRIRRAGR
jgi:hypothetical protein